MARHDDREAEREMREAKRLEPFVQGGLSRLVKVIPAGEQIPRMVTGYVTQEKFLLGLTPIEIERALGLPLGSLRSGCRVLALQRQPGPSQVVYELTTKYPDGLAYSLLSDERYPPGSRAHIHQWRLTTKIRASLLCDLGPDTRYTAPARARS